MKTAFVHVLADDDGAALVEYGIITAGIALAAMGALQAMGVSIDTLMTNTVAHWSSAARSGQ